MRCKGMLFLLVSVVAGCQFSESGAASGLEETMKPRYDEDGNVLRPEGYRQWTFVGTSLGLRYAEDRVPEEGPGSFHNVYAQPEAHAYFMEHGVFPEKTILAMETYQAGTREPKSELTGLSAAIKDTERFDETWGYVSFEGRDRAAPFPKERCYVCHAKHAAADNVFTQLYPILRR